MDATHKDNYFIFTGGPGAGKTSVIDALKEQGYVAVDEVARDIIKQQVATGGNATHTGDQEAFCRLMLDASIVNYQQYMDVQSPVFFDRGIPGLYGYSLMTTGRVVDEVADAVNRYRYHQQVFIFPPWEAIYQKDTERQQDFDEAIDTYDNLKAGHIACGYSVIEVPKVGVEERVSFILELINS